VLLKPIDDHTGADSLARNLRVKLAWLALDEAKRGGANALVEWEEVALQELLRSVDFDLERQHPAYGTHVFAPPGVPRPKAFRQTYYFEDEVGKEEVTALCKRYLDFLDKMLNDFCTDNQRASPR